MQFELHPPNSGTALMRSINLRESSASEAAAVARDPIQRVFEVMNTKTILEKEQNNKIANREACKLLPGTHQVREH